MQPKILYLLIVDEFNIHRNEQNAVQMKKYMRDLFPFYGIKSPLRKELSYRFLAELKKQENIDWDFVESCWNASEREMQYVALDYLRDNTKKLTDKDLPNIESLINRKTWWDSIDFLDRIVGNIALRYPELNQTILEWSLHPNIWYRRIAIDHQLDRRNKTNTELLEKIIVNNLNQKEFFINKAIGWALRAYSKTDPEWVRNFIEKHRDNLATLSIREASKYI